MPSASTSSPQAISSDQLDAMKDAQDILLEGIVRDDDEIAELSQGDPEEVILYYPWEGVDGVQLYRQDFRQLEPPGWLDDSLIEIGLKLFQIRLEEANPELAEQIHIFTPFFYPILSKNTDNLEEGYRHVRGWTDADKVDIFRKKYLVVPINRSFHWYLAIIYHPEYALDDSTEERRCVLTSYPVDRQTTVMTDRASIWTLDPLGFDRPEVVDTLAFYLKAEAREKHGVSISDQKLVGRKALTPTQPNWYDCGPYILVFAKAFMTSPDDFLESISGNKAESFWVAEEFQAIRNFLKAEINKFSKQWTAWKKSH
ncbi:hypothetical protein D9758_009461 [Tetrapyrgos nigripes]|uniref:Ubiquitin-like protease family profile domain-containing protein n=1 Tax=Tetrapyrgos nigripes TaxID=182062 RepID=A0A8H5LFY1_9AGAR|nr:hypothetical protein D9758_009461 [Tetrapyrgos nigripes]